MSGSIENPRAPFWMVVTDGTDESLTVGAARVTSSS